MLKVMHYVNVLRKHICFKCLLNSMSLGAHLSSSCKKFQSDAAAVSIRLFPNVTVLLRFDTSDVVFVDLR